MNYEPVAHFYPEGEGATVYDIKFAWKVTGTTEPIPLYTHPAKTLTNAVVNELWAESQEDGIAMQQGFTTQQHYFAYLILRKAQEI